jgi:hypothetical protein
MIEFLSSNLASGIFGAILGSLIANWLNIKNERIKLAMDFHKEWNSYEMSVQRRLGYHCIKAYPDTRYSDLTNWDENGSLSVFTVLRFYERLWHCFNTNRLDKQLAATLFYQNFYWWYFISFSTSLKSSKDEWPAYNDIENLKIKFREYTSEADYRIYEKKYTKKYNDYVSAKPAAIVQSNIKTANAITINGTGNFVIS